MFEYVAGLLLAFGITALAARRVAASDKGRLWAAIPTVGVGLALTIVAVLSAQQVYDWPVPEIVNLVHSSQLAQWLLGISSGVLLYFLIGRLAVYLTLSPKARNREQSRLAVFYWTIPFLTLLIVSILLDRGRAILGNIRSLNTPLVSINFTEKQGESSSIVDRYIFSDRETNPESVDNSKLDYTGITMVSRLRNYVYSDAILKYVIFSTAETGNSTDKEIVRKANMFYPNISRYVNLLNNKNNETDKNDNDNLSYELSFFVEDELNVTFVPALTTKILAFVEPLAACLQYVDDRIRYRPNFDPYIAGLGIALRAAVRTLNPDRMVRATQIRSKIKPRRMHGENVA